MGEVAELGDVRYGVARRGSCAELRSAYIDGVGTVADGLQTTLEVAGGGEEFDGVHRREWFVS